MPLGTRRCEGTNAHGEPCRSPPQREEIFCRMHDPALKAEVAQARRLGGLRRRRESAVKSSFNFEGSAPCQRSVD